MCAQMILYHLLQELLNFLTFIQVELKDCGFRIDYGFYSKLTFTLYPFALSSACCFAWARSAATISAHIC